MLIGIQNFVLLSYMYPEVIEISVLVYSALNIMLMTNTLVHKHRFASKHFVTVLQQQQTEKHLFK